MASKTQTELVPSSADNLAPDLLRDLLDPALTSIEVAHRHNLDPLAYRAAVRSQAFREAAEALRDADQERTDLLTPLMHARALHTLARIANQPTTTPSQTESARRASTALLKVRRHSVPTPPGGTARRAVSSSSSSSSSALGGADVPPVLPPRGADLQSASRAQPEPPPSPPTLTPNPNPLAEITGDPTLTFEDSLRLIAEIETLRRGLSALPGGTGVPPVLLDQATIPTPALPTPPQTPSTPVAQLLARAGAAP